MLSKWLSIYYSASLFLFLLALFTWRNGLLPSTNRTIFSSCFGLLRGRAFIKSKVVKEKKIFHDFNVSQSLPRFLRTTSFVVLCLIFFLCETGMDSRFQLRLLFHCAQGLFQRSHMGYCDEGTRWGVFSEPGRNQRAARDGSPTPQHCRPILLGTAVSEYPFYSPSWPLTKAIILNLCWNSEVLEVDKSWRQDCFKCTYDLIRSCLTSSCSVEHIHFPCPKRVISVVGKSQIGAPRKLYGTLIWDILNQESCVFFFWFNVY